MIRRLTGLLPYLVFVALLGLRIWDPLPLQQMRLLVFDAYQRIEPRQYDPEIPVRIVDVDNDSLARIGQWPWPRSVFAKLVERLNEAGAAAIAFDIVFAEPDRSSPEQALRLWPATPEVLALRDSVAALPSHDRLLAAAMKGAPVITGFVLTQEDATPAPRASSGPGEKARTASDGADGAKGEVEEVALKMPAQKATFALAGDDPSPFVPPFTNAVVNLAFIEAASVGNGALNSVPDLDQVTRRTPLVLRLNDTLYPTLLAEALRVAQGARTNFIKSSGASGVEAFGEQTGLHAVRIGEFEIPTDANGRVWGRFTKHEDARYISAWKLLQDDFDPALVAGQIVFIGVSAPGLFDLRSTPLEPVLPGVEIHAQIVEQIIAGDFLHRPGFADAVELAYMFVLGILLILSIRRFGAITSIAIGSAATVLVIAGSWFAYDIYDWIFDPVQPSIMVLFVFVTAEGVSYMHSEAERRQVRSAFQHYLSPELVDRLAEQPDQLRLGGEQRQMSVLFSDIRGFTAISESYKDDPQGLTRFLNRFLTPMTNVILEQQGTIDKYIGDAIMAFWNAPLDDPDHGRHACQAALNMHAALEQLNAAIEGGEPSSGDPVVPETAAKRSEASTAGRKPLRKEAEEGFVRAQYRLGKAYRDGDGFLADAGQAAHWFERAAKQGYAPAQRNLGFRYLTGEGVETEPLEAAFWLALALRNGASGFEAEAEECRRGLDSVALREIETRILSWKPEAESSRSIRLVVGLGINSGECVVGNLGSDHRFDYSVLGDTVNLASRLEGQTKTYGVPIIINESTRDLAPEFATLELDFIAVKGRREPTRIFALMGTPEMARQQAFQQLEQAHQQFIAAYRGQRWDEARRLLDSCRSTDEGLADFYDMYESRIGNLEREPPGESWDGVFVALTK